MCVPLFGPTNKINKDFKPNTLRSRLSELGLGVLLTNGRPGHNLGTPKMILFSSYMNRFTPTFGLLTSVDPLNCILVVFRLENLGDRRFFRPALSTTMRVVSGVLRASAHVWSEAQLPRLAGLSQLDQLRFGAAHL